MIARRVALVVLLLGLAVLLWPLDGADPRSSALYPNYDHLIEDFPILTACSEPGSGCAVGYFVEDSVTERRLAAVTLWVLGCGMLLAAYRRGRA